ncbi:hypothetical protein LSAT2_019813 [Lamellibrachia satsuma]|nr:hypothetical protein LSAT2_019813 [Lamellibrachia satsuma]
MPTAGAIIPPQITPLRNPVQGQPSTHINTATYIELDTETPGCKIFFSTDGTKPTPFQLKQAGRETTFKYRGPFTLKSGKRALKVIAISRDELHESNVVTKTFIVDDVGPPSDDVDSLFNGGGEDEENGLMVPTRSLKRPYSANRKKKPLRNSVNLNRISLPTGPKNAWDETAPSADTNVLVNSFFDPVTNAATTNSSVNIPDGPFNPTNYSGTQLNFWGVAPPGGVPMPPANGYSAPYGNPAHLGPMTSNMLSSLEKPTVSVADLKAMDGIHNAPRQAAEPELKPQSPANGDWKGQLEHIYAHLLDHCKRDMTFRTSVGQPKLGKILHADFDEEDTAYLLTVSIAKSGVTQPVKTMKKASPAKAVASKQQEKPKPKPQREPPKEKPKPKTGAEGRGIL